MPNTGFREVVRTSVESIHPETKRTIGVIFLFALGGVALLSLAHLAGALGEAFLWLLGILFGRTRFIFPLVVVSLAYLFLRKGKYDVKAVHVIGLFSTLITFTAFWHLGYEPGESWVVATSGGGGGVIGYFLGYSLRVVLGFWGALITLIALFLSSIVIFFNTSIEAMQESAERGKTLFGMFRDAMVRFRNLFITEEEVVVMQGEEATPIPEFAHKTFGASDDEAIEEEGEESVGETFEEDGALEEGAPTIEPIVVPKRPRRKVQLALDLLDKKTYQPQGIDIVKTKLAIQKTLESFGISVEMGEANVGPTVTQFTFKPAEGVKLASITALHNDLALALAAHPIRIEAPIPGKPLVGVEVPNQKAATVTMYEILSSDIFKKRKHNMFASLGKDVSGLPHLLSVIGAPHMLIAGATGSGKSVCVNSIIISLLYQNGPDELRFIMVDPKRVELTGYNNIPHLLTPVITDSRKAINALKWTVGEMDRRFDTLSAHGKRDIVSFNKEAAEKLPYIVVIIDELADIMVTSGPEVESLIIRLAQMARAVGIHLILATQRPSVDVITGLIKANVTTRIAFSVASQMDSRTILDTSGAEKLIGKGDMLYVSAELAKPVRLQGVFISDEEIKRVVDILKESGDPQYEEEIVQKITTGGGGGSGADEDDDMLPQAKEVVIQAKKASASLLQRRLRVGYARAARLLDLLEAQGIIGPGDGAKPREVLIGSADDLDMMEGQEEFHGGDDAWGKYS